MKEVDDVLTHFGINGMHWGVRSKSGGRSSSDIAKLPLSEDHKQSRVLLKTGARKMSTAELKKVNERLQLEQSFKQLKPSAVKNGNEKAKRILATATTVVALVTLVKSPGFQAIVHSLKSKMGG